MYNSLRNSGLPVLEDLPWGTLLCQFYGSRTDLLELLVPYFKVGLENNEFCLWVACDPITSEEAFEEMERHVPNFSNLVKNKNIEILPGHNWYLGSGRFNANGAKEAWIEKFRHALDRGFNGMRIGGIQCWVGSNQRNDIINVEKELNTLVSNHKIIVLCTHPISTLEDKYILDLVHAHDCIVSKRKGEWQSLEKSGLSRRQADVVSDDNALNFHVAVKNKKLSMEIEDLKLQIEEQKKIASQLEREKELSDQLLNSIPGIVVMFDENLKYLGWNKEFENVSGYTSDKILAMHPIEDFFPDEASKERVYRITNEIFEKGVASCEVNTVFRGKRTVLSLTGRRINYQEKPAALSIGVDITEIKEAEEKLKRAYRFLTYLVENTPLAVIHWDKDFRVTRWAGQAEKIFGWKASEVVGKNMFASDFPFVYPVDKARAQKVAYSLVEGVVDRTVTLNRNFRRDGKVIYCEWYNSVVRDDQGNPLSILALTQDVTKRKEAEQKLKQSYKEIRQLSFHLQNAREQERKNVAREMHDELGQQLTVLKMEASWLKKNLKVIDENANQRLTDLNNLLDSTIESFERISMGLRPSLLDQFGLVPAMEWHLKDFEKRFGIKAVFTYTHEELELKETMMNNLFRIFQESLTNVARHSGARLVEVRLQKTKTLLSLLITDDGKGFDPGEVQGRRTLGILGMKERAASIGGKYRIESKPGRGTKVLVVTPAD